MLSWPLIIARSHQSLSYELFMKFIINAQGICLGLFGTNGWVQPFIPNRLAEFNRLFQIDQLSSTVCRAKQPARQGFCPPNRRDDLCLVLSSNLFWPCPVILSSYLSWWWPVILSSYLSWWCPVVLSSSYLSWWCPVVLSQPDGCLICWTEHAHPPLPLTSRPPVAAASLNTHIHTNNDDFFQLFEKQRLIPAHHIPKKNIFRSKVSIF